MDEMIYVNRKYFVFVIHFTYMNQKAIEGVLDNVTQKSHFIYKYSYILENIIFFTYSYLRNYDCD